MRQLAASVPSEVAARLAGSLPVPVVRSLMLHSIESYGQETEFRADHFGLIYAVKAGYDRRAGAAFLAKVAEIKERGTVQQEKLR